MLDAVFALFFCLAAGFCGEGTAGDVENSASARAQP
jgi:hypothetical protein